AIDLATDLLPRRQRLFGRCLPGGRSLSLSATSVAVLVFTGGKAAVTLESLKRHEILSHHYSGFLPDQTAWTVPFNFMRRRRAHFHWRIECSGLFELGASRFGSSAALGSMVNTRQQHTSESAPRQPLDGDGTAAAEDRLTRAAGTRQSLWSRI